MNVDTSSLQRQGKRIDISLPTAVGYEVSSQLNLTLADHIGTHTRQNFVLLKWTVQRYVGLCTFLDKEGLIEFYFSLLSNIRTSTGAAVVQEYLIARHSRHCVRPTNVRMVEEQLWCNFCWLNSTIDRALSLINARNGNMFTFLRDVVVNVFQTFLASSNALEGARHLARVSLVHKVYDCPAGLEEELQLYLYHVLLRLLGLVRTDYITSSGFKTSCLFEPFVLSVMVSGTDASTYMKTENGTVFVPLEWVCNAEYCRRKISVPLGSTIEFLEKEYPIHACLGIHKFLHEMFNNFTAMFIAFDYFVHTTTLGERNYQRLLAAPTKLGTRASEDGVIGDVGYAFEEYLLGDGKRLFGSNLTKKQGVFRFSGLRTEKVHPNADGTKLVKRDTEEISNVVELVTAFTMSDPASLDFRTAFNAITVPPPPVRIEPVPEASVRTSTRLTGTKRRAPFSVYPAWYSERGLDDSDVGDSDEEEYRPVTLGGAEMIHVSSSSRKT